MKNTKKIALAAMSLVAAGVAAAGATGTFAWFAVNNKVTVTGMTFKTQVSSNLLIAETNAEANFTSTLNQSRDAKLEPVSSVSGLDGTFFYTAKGAADGHIAEGNYAAYSEAASLSNTAAGKSNYDNGFNTAYGVDMSVGENAEKLAKVLYGYVDYTFYLKAMSSVDDSVLALTKANMLYNGAALGANDLAWRVAVIKNSATVSANNPYTGALANVSTLSKGRVVGDYQTSGKAVKSGDTNVASGDLVNFNTAAVIADDLDAGAVNYYFVTVRLWLEGEDKKCTNETYLTLTNSYSLDLEFQLGTSAAGATAITSVVPNP